MHTVWTGGGTGNCAVGRNAFFCTEVGAMFLLLTATLFLCKQDTKQQLDGTPIVIHKGGGNPELSARFGIADIPTPIFFKN